MYLIHQLKSSQHQIPLDADKALRPEAFATVHEKRKGVVTHVGFTWTLESAAEQGKYQGHTFTFMIPVNAVERLYEVLGKLKERFEKDELPIGDTNGRA